MVAKIKVILAIPDAILMHQHNSRRANLVTKLLSITSLLHELHSSPQLLVIPANERTADRRRSQAHRAKTEIIFFCYKEYVLLGST